MVYACIAPHGDEVVPALAGGKRTLAEETTNGMRRLAAEMKRARPDTMVVATPHNLRLMGKIGVVVAENSSGTVEARAKSISVDARCDVEFALALLSSAEEAGISVVGANYGTASGPLSNLRMDWGTLIPLWFFLHLNRLKSRIVIVTPSREIPLEQNYRFGAKLAELAERGKKRIAFIASSDQAHAHEKTGPYGYSPRAEDYDRRVVRAIREDKLEDILAFEPSLVEGAKSDSLWQMAMLAGAIAEVRMTGRLYSYEVPTYFGMLCAGYTRPGTARLRRGLEGPALLDHRRSESDVHHRVRE